jgi:hypothetical protein
MGNKNRNRNLNELAREIHSDAVEYGFYEPEYEARQRGEYSVFRHIRTPFFARRIGSIRLKLDRVLELCREGRFVKAVDLEWALSTTNESHLYEKHYPEKIANTIEDELAGVVIRVLDICGDLGIDIQAHVDLRVQRNRYLLNKYEKSTER